MIRRSLRSGRRRHSPSRKHSKTRNRVLRSESLEARMLLSGLSPLESGLSPAALVGAATPSNQAPTITQPLTINGNAPVTGKSASLSVQASGSNLVYIWSVTSSTGGTATFSANDTAAAYNATATFTKAGSYTISVKIMGAGNLSVTASQSVVVSPVLTSLVLKTAGGQVLSPTSALAVSAASQTLSVQGLDQFGNALAVQPAFTWSTTTKPAGAAAPTVAATSTGATITFYQAGSYGLSVQTSAAGVFSASVSMTVAQVLSAVQFPSGVPTYFSCSGTSQKLTVPTFLDQFGNVMAVSPALSWSTSAAAPAHRRRPSRPAGASPRSRSRWPVPTC